MRELITDKVNFLEDLINFQKTSTVPDIYYKPIKKTKSELLGLYKRRSNAHVCNLELRVNKRKQPPAPVLSLEVEKSTLT